MKLGILLFCGLVSGGVSAIESVTKDALEKALIQSRYLARRIMVSMFEDTERYIRALYEYVDGLEAARFRENAKTHYYLFVDKYKEFLDAVRDLERTYQRYKVDTNDDYRIDKLNIQLERMEKAFTSVTKVYTKSFRKINASLTKLDETKIMYTDAEVFKTYSRITVRCLNHLAALEKIIEIANTRGGECGPILNRDNFFNEAISKVREMHSKTEEIATNLPTSILSEEEFDKLKEDYESVKKYYAESIDALYSLDKGLEGRYKEKGLGYDRRFKREINLIKDLPMRISGFLAPNVAIAFLVSFCVFFQA